MKFTSVDMKDNNMIVSFLVLSPPKSYFIKIPESDHLAWLLRWQRQDIMNSQLYLKRLTPRLDASYPLLRHLPLPIRYVRP